MGLGEQRCPGRRRRVVAEAGGRSCWACATLRSHRGEGVVGDRGRGVMAGGGERPLERADDEAAHQRGIAEADLGLGRVDVDVDHVGREIDEERRHGMAAAVQQVGVGRAHGAVQQAVAHRPAVDEEILVLRAGAVEGGQRRVAGEAHALALGVDGERVLGEVAAHDQREAREAPGRRIFVGPSRSRARLPSTRVKPMAGWHMARRLTTSAA